METLEEKLEDLCDAYNAAIEYTLRGTCNGELLTSADCIYFLSLWNEGAWEDIAQEYPDFDLSSATACGYVA